MHTTKTMCNFHLTKKNDCTSEKMYINAFYMDCLQETKQRKSVRVRVITNIVLLSTYSLTITIETVLVWTLTNKFWPMVHHSMFVLSSPFLLAWQLIREMLIPQGLLVKETGHNIMLCLQETKRKSVRMQVIQKPMLLIISSYHRNILELQTTTSDP